MVKMYVTGVFKENLLRRNEITAEQHFLTNINFKNLLPAFVFTLQVQGLLFIELLSVPVIVCSRD